MDLSGFRQFVEESQTYQNTLSRELGVDSDELAKFYSQIPIMLAGVNLGDTKVAQLPVKILSIDTENGTATVQVDDTFSPNYNPKPEMKQGKKTYNQQNWEREPKTMVVPLNHPVSSGGKGATLQSILSQGWQQPQDPMGGDPMGGGMGGMGGGGGLPGLM